MPVVSIEAPPGINLDAKRRMLKKVADAIDEGYDGIASKGGAEILVFLHETQLENVGLLTSDYSGLQSENPAFGDLKKVKSA